MPVVRRFVLAVVVLGLSLAGWNATRAAGDEVTELKLENLLQETLDANLSEELEITVSYIEIPAGTTLPRHSHPGEEFIYFLEGEAELLIDGKDPMTGGPGAVGHVPYMAKHTARTGDGAARAVVFRVHRKGEPVRILEDGTESDH